MACIFAKDLIFRPLNCNQNHDSVMKRLFSLAVALSATVCFAQNVSPTIEVLSVNLDEVTQQVTINYHLQDQNDDLCEVWIKYSVDGGVFFEAPANPTVSGDVGDGIAPSDQLSLTWDFSDLSDPIADVRVKVYASDHVAVDIAEMVAQVNEDQLLNFLQEVEGERHYQAAPVHLETVRQIMFDAFN